MLNKTSCYPIRSYLVWQCPGPHWWQVSGRFSPRSTKHLFDCTAQKPAEVTELDKSCANLDAAGRLIGLSFVQNISDIFTRVTHRYTYSSMFDGFLEVRQCQDILTHSIKSHSLWAVVDKNDSASLAEV